MKALTYNGMTKIIQMRIEQGFYSDGKLWYELTYVNDVVHGRGRDYYPNDNKRWDWNNSNGELEGEGIFYEY